MSSHTAQFFKSLAHAIGGAVVGGIVLAVGEAVFWAVMALLCWCGWLPVVDSTQAGRLFSNVGFSFLFGIPFGAACGALIGIYFSFVKD
jgi:hypothetical protein